MDLYNENDFKRPGEPASEEDLRKAMRIKALDGCFIPKELESRWYIDRENGKLVYIGNLKTEQKTD